MVFEDTEGHSDLPQRDAALIRQICASDALALEALMDAYAGWLVDVATPLVGSSDLAQDAVQDVFMRLWDIRATLDLRGSVPGYLYRAVRNRARNLSIHERAQHALGTRAQLSANLDEPHAVNTGEANLADADFRHALGVALQTLQPRTRDIFLMRFQAEMSYAEIAETLGIGVPTARLQMSRAVKALTTHLRRWAGISTEEPTVEQSTEDR